MAKVGERPGFAASVDDLFPPGSRVARFFELLEQLEDLAPELAAWIIADHATRGPRPTCDAAALELHEALRRLASGG